MSNALKKCEKKMKIAFHYLGCRLNEAENEQSARAFVEAGHRIVSIDEHPDVILLNTCGVTAEAMRKSRNYARRMATYRPRLLVLMGCAIDLMASGENPLDDAELRESFGENATDPLEIIRILRPDRPQVARIVLEAIDRMEEAQTNETTPVYPLRMRSFIKVQDGCNNKCSYCAVRLARGPERSEPTEAVLSEIRKCLDLGEREIVLTGVQVGGWREGNRRLCDLVADILAKTDVKRLRLSSIEPWHLRPELWALWRDRRLCPHFHVPVQSGSDAVLVAMRRRTPIGGYLEKIHAIRSEIAGARISTDLIVGFPSEDETMWAQTLDFIQRAQFDSVHLFRFSARPGTDAAAMPHQIPAELKRKRWYEAESLIREIQRRRLEACVGASGLVLWESAVKKLGSRVLWQGYSENYLQYNRWFDESDIQRGDITCEKFGTEDIEANCVI